MGFVSAILRKTGPAVFAALVMLPLIHDAPAQAAAQQATTAGITIAVLPFANASGDAAQDFFADGMTDEIAGALTRVPGLVVTGRSSSFRLKSQNRDNDAIIAALKPAYLVEGSARKAEDRIRMSVKLIRASDKMQLWAEDYYATYEDIFDLQNDAAVRIAEALRVPTGLKAGETLVRRITDMDVYEAYLKARPLIRARGTRPFAEAASLLEQVVSRDPDYVPALALLAFDYDLTPLFSPVLRAGTPAEAKRVVETSIPRAEMLARHAVAMDPKSADGFAALGYSQMVQGKFIAAEDDFKQALALDPNQTDALHGYSQLLAAFGRIKESLAMRLRLQAVEPSIINYTADTAEIYWLDGDTQTALKMLEEFRPGRTAENALINAGMGRYREAAALLREMPATNYPPGVLEAAASTLESAPAKPAQPDSIPRLSILGYSFLYVGLPERVMEYYESNLAAGYFQPISTTWFWHESFAPVRKLDRFKAFARNVGLVEYWRARGWPAGCRPAGANDFTCD